MGENITVKPIRSSLRLQSNSFSFLQQLFDIVLAYMFDLYLKNNNNRFKFHEFYFGISGIQQNICQSSSSCSRRVLFEK